MMPSLEDVEGCLRGVALLARNRPEGLKQFDVSVEGFWASFWAIAYSVPAMALTWASYRLAWLQNAGEHAGAGAGFIGCLALTDVLTWIVPLVLLALAARPLGIARHFVRYVIVTNWLGLATSYAMAVPSLLRLLVPQAMALAALLSILIFVGTIVVLYRATRLAFDGDSGNAGAVTAGMVVVSLMLTGSLQQVFGIAIQ